MACGARVAPSLTPRDGNGAGAAPAPAAAAPDAVPPGTKQAYALSFSPLVDERLRYRVARWVVERAPAHGLTEVQEDLEHGTFVTFLALTADEAEVARQGIHGLGVAPPLLRLAPATTAQMLLPDAGAVEGTGEALGRAGRLAHARRRGRGAPRLRPGGGASDRRPRVLNRPGQLRRRPISEGTT